MPQQLHSPATLLGQWIIATESSEQLVLNLDEILLDGSISGSANLTWFPQSQPQGGQSFAVRINVADGRFQATARCIARYNEQMERFQPDSAAPPIVATFDPNADCTMADISVISGDLTGRSWRVEKLQLDAPSRIVSTPVSWDEFCSWAHVQSRAVGRSDTFIYRGHKRSTFPLRTTFHRTGRSDMHRYVSNVRELLHRISALTLQRYSLNNLSHLFELIGIGQHHGYATPLLDWTASPFIAAYFAFAHNVRGRSEMPDDSFVRIIQCNATGMQPSPSPTNILDPRAVIMTLQSDAIANPRVIPQQSVFTFTNVVDVEALIHQIGVWRGERLMDAWDISIGERDKALADLRSMGITDRSMFPGMDGACRDLHQLHFGVRDES